MKKALKYIKDINSGLIKSKDEAISLVRLYGMMKFETKFDQGKVTTDVFMANDYAREKVQLSNAKLIN